MHSAREERRKVRMMIQIDFDSSAAETARMLLAEHPNGVQQVAARNSGGAGTDMALILSLATVAIPEVRKIIVELIHAGKYRSVTIKGKKITGYGAEDVKRILDALGEDA